MSPSECGVIFLFCEDLEVLKQPTRGVLRKRCFENMQQIYKRALMLKCGLNIVSLQFYRNHTSAWVLSTGKGIGANY